MERRPQRWLLILTLLAVSIGIIGAGFHFRSRGVIGFIQAEMQFLAEDVGELSERSQEHDEQIQLIVDHIRDLKASICDLPGSGPLPDFCGVSTCVPGICEIRPDPCEALGLPPGCEDAAGG